MDGALGLEKWSQCRSALNLKPQSNLISIVHTSTNILSLAKLLMINNKQMADGAGGWLLGGTYFIFGCRDSWLNCNNINHYKEHVCPGIFLWMRRLCFFIQGFRRSNPLFTRLHISPGSVFRRYAELLLWLSRLHYWAWHSKSSYF